ncbi:unnamed protein product [Rangifer tarandus platyrhynchus]|uniref:Uncharacterized protein n=1 Tax=Rangifer tarandus platyrhynchus TaxID=3082113 RepID=A0ABN9A6U4_RANTA|nr:unnamed protein product [Rangifer tarandus platyrhynchus]CAI9180694.1 unnamed protein product [Rangifer tarandus platyrhynchus]
MSSPDDEVSVWGAGFCPEGREQTCIPRAGSAAPQGPGLGSKVRTSRSGEGEGGDGYPNPEGFNSEWEVLEAGGAGAVGLRRPAWFPGRKTKGTPCSWLTSRWRAFLRQLSDLDILGVRRYLSLESYVITDVSSLWADLEAGPSGRGTVPQSCGAAVLAAAGPLQVGGAEAGRAWGNPKRCTKSRLNVAADHQQPPSEGSFGLLSDSESSDEFSERELMRVSIYPKEGGQAKLNSLKDPGNTPRCSNVQGREDLLNVPGTRLSSAPPGLISVVERQGRQGDAEQEDASPPKKMQSVLWGEGGSLPSYPRVALASARAAATTGSGPRPTPRRKGVQEKKSLGGVSKPAVGRTFPSWGQGISATPLEPATFPPISGIPLRGGSKKYALVLWGAEESKHTGAGKKPVARRAWGSMAAMAVSGEEKDPNRDPFPKGQLTTGRPGPSCPWVQHGEPSSANLNIRGAQDSENSEPVAMNKGEVRPGGPGPSGDQEPSDHPPRPKRQQQPRGRQGCPRCLVLQREIDDLKKQLAAMQHLADKFQIL